MKMKEEEIKKKVDEFFAEACGPHVSALVRLYDHDGEALISAGKGAPWIPLGGFFEIASIDGKAREIITRALFSVAKGDFKPRESEISMEEAMEEMLRIFK